MSAKLISIIGPVAVGKTTLAEHLGEELPADILYEDYKSNPFLPGSFRGFEELSLPSQLYFLLSRAKQLSEQTFPAEGVIVSDYGFCQDRLFADAKLGDDDRRLYEHVARRIGPLVHPPDVLVHLDASIETLRERIERRGRDFEIAFSEEFMVRMRRAHDNVIVPPACRLLRVDCESVDLMDPTVRTALMREIREAL